MLNGKFIATRDYYVGDAFTKGKVYELIDGEITVDNSFRTFPYEWFLSLDSFQDVLIPYTETETSQDDNNHKTHVEIANKLDTDDSTMVEFKFVDRYSEVMYKATGDKLNYLPNVINEFVEFAKHLGFKEETVIRFMKEFVENSEI